MKKLTLLTAASLFLFSAYSQNDSTRLDVGGVVLKRAFTQNVTIKGEDLEKMPFASLSEAINVWLYGSYTTPAHITYVVDGNVTSEVNSYSIHDIEEVVLVQNAAALNSTGGIQPQMILVTTRKGKAKSGIQAAAQTFLASKRKSTTNLYHQYYVSAYRNLNKISFGLSANYLRDVNPSQKIDYLHIRTPDNMERWRLNGYFVWRPDSRNTIEVHAGFTPQSIDSANDYIEPNIYGHSYNQKAHEHTNLFLPSARWHAEWLPGLRNDLLVGVASELQKGDYQSLYIPGDTTVNRQYTQVNATSHSDHLYVRDRISYQIAAGGGWSVEPSFYTSYEQIKYGYSQTSLTTSGRKVGPGSTDLGTMLYANSYSTSLHSKLYVLTPAVDISYKQIFNFQGGVSANVSDAHGQKGLKRVFPFASTTVDLLGLSDRREHASLKLSGSYAQRGGYILNDYMLNDLSNISSAFVSLLQVGGVWTGSGTPPSVQGTNVKSYWVWQAGASYTSKDNRWEASYNFQRSNFITIGSVFTGPTSVTFVYSEWKSSQHFLRLNVRLVDKGAFTWRTGLTATVIRNKTSVYADQYQNDLLGEHMEGNNRPSWTGGWTHRLQYKALSFGVDMLYHFNREVPTILPSGAPSYFRTNNFLLQNVYVGYKLHLPGKTGLEIYADSRGLVRSDKYGLLVERRYYGVGGKITM